VGEEEEEEEETARQIQVVEMTARGGEQAAAEDAAAAAGGMPAAHIPLRSSLRLNSKRLAAREIAEAEDDAAMAVALASAAGVEAIVAAHEQHRRPPQKEDDEGTLPERDLGRLPHSRSQSMENVLRAHSGRLRPSREPSSDALPRGPLEGVMHSGAAAALAPEADSDGTLPPRDARLLASPPSPKERALSGRLRPSLPGEE